MTNKIFDDAEALTERNFGIFAVRHYSNPQCLDASEFEEDLARFKYIQRLLRKYRDTGEIKERLVLNHLIALGNVFGIESTTRMLFYRIDRDLHHVLKTFLLFLSYVPDNQYQEISVDPIIGSRLKNI